jgi:hypothetical protein
MCEYALQQSLEIPSQLFPLRSVPNGTDNHSLAPHTIENNVRSAADDQLADARLGPGAPEARTVLKASTTATILVASRSAA